LQGIGAASATASIASSRRLPRSSFATNDWAFSGARRHLLGQSSPPARLQQQGQKLAVLGGAEGFLKDFLQFWGPNGRRPAELNPLSDYSK